MLAPQSMDEVQPVIDALRRIDPLLDVIWNPNAKLLTRPFYSVTGQLTPGTYDGRWQVIRYNTAHTSAQRDYCLICTVTKPTEVGGILCLVDDGEYMHVGPWLVDLMRSADAANVRAFTEIRNKLWAQDDAIEHANDAAEEAAEREALDKVHFDAAYAGGVGNWQGTGAAFTH